MSGFHITLNEGEYENKYRAARAVLTRICHVENPDSAQQQAAADLLVEENHQHLSSDHSTWNPLSDESATESEWPADWDTRWFADFYSDTEIFVPDDICRVAPEPQPVQVQPEQSPVTPPPPPADAGTQPDAGADDQDAGATPPAQPDAATTTGDAGVDADGDSVNDADQAEADDAARRRDAQRRENGNGHETGTQPSDAGRPEAPVIPGT
ncbi:hypothetical protein HZC35_03320 [Candidatus Saganbacteria bacterium]|nr:hypothetical protein [Candidatus Saganbacteria bacterium]